MAMQAAYGWQEAIEAAAKMVDAEAVVWKRKYAERRGLTEAECYLLAKRLAKAIRRLGAEPRL
jgi:hypothetical protein